MQRSKSEWGVTSKESRKIGYSQTPRNTAALVRRRGKPSACLLGALQSGWKSFLVVLVLGIQPPSFSSDREHYLLQVVGAGRRAASLPAAGRKHWRGIPALKSFYLCGRSHECEALLFPRPFRLG